MFRPKLIEEIRCRYSALGALESEALSWDGVGLNLGSYDLINMALVYRQAMEESGGRTAVVCSSDRVTRVLGVLAIALALCELDFEDHATDLAATLRPGDYVKVDGSLGRYVRYDQDLGFCVRFRKHKDSGSATLLYIPKYRAHRIIRYEGNARRLNHYKPGRRRTDIATELIAQVMGKDLSEITGLLHKRRTMVVGGWQFAESLNELQIHGEAFGDIFPTAYYSSSSNRRNVGHRASQKTPNICVVPNLAVGRDLALSDGDNQIQALLVNKAASLGGHAATLDQIGVERVVAYKRASEWRECRELEELDFRVWLWSEADLAQASRSIRVTETAADETKGAEQASETPPELVRHMKAAQGGATKMEVERIEMPAGWYDKAGAVERGLDQLREINRDLQSPELRSFLSMGWFALINVSSFPYVPEPPPSTGQENGDVVSRLLDRLRTIAGRLPGRVLVGELSHLPNRLLGGLEELRHMIGQDNPRAVKVLDWVTGRQEPSLIVVRHSSFVEPTRACLGEVARMDGRVVTPRDVAKEQDLDSVLYTAWPGRKEVDRLYDCVPRNYTFLLGKHEETYFEAYMRFRAYVAHRYTDPAERARLLDVDEGLFERRSRGTAEPTTAHDDAPEEPDDILSEIVNSGTGASSGATSGQAPDGQVEAYRVDFEEDAHGYFTKGFRARVMDRATSHLERKKVEELQVGDELIFAGGSSRDIFEALASEVEGSPKMREVVQLSEAWWRALRRYMDSTGQRVGDVMKELSAAGFDYQPGTIWAWVQGERMRPGGYSMREVITAIAAITGDDTLTQKIDEVISACGKRQSVHVKLGKYLTQQITRAVVDDDTEQIDDAFKPIADKLARSADVVTVCAVADTPSEVERSETNRLIRDRHAMWVDLFEDIKEI
jgi:hypothetical protein